MKLIGIYPFDKDKPLHKLYGFVLYTLVMAPGAFLGFIQLFLGEDATEIKYDDLATIVMIFLSPKLLSVVTKRSNIYKCIHYFEKEIFVNQSNDHFYIINDCVKTCRRMNIFFVGCVISIVTWCGNLFFRHAHYQLPINVWLPFNLEDMPVFFYCFYFDLVLGVIYLALAAGTTDPLIAGLICHAAGQIRVLKENLRQLNEHFVKIDYKGDIFDSRYMYNMIRECLIHYDGITQFVKEYEQSFSVVIFFQFMESSIVIGICCFQISKMQVFDVNFAITANYLSFLLLQVYFYCYYGTLLIEENNSLSTVIYTSNWYEYSKDSKKALIILMERSKRPLAVSAGKIADLSLETFTLILKRSYSLLAVLKNY